MAFDFKRFETHGAGGKRVSTNRKTDKTANPGPCTSLSSLACSAHPLALLPPPIGTPRTQSA